MVDDISWKLSRSLRACVRCGSDCSAPGLSRSVTRASSAAKASCSAPFPAPVTHRSHVITQSLRVPRGRRKRATGRKKLVASSECGLRASRAYAAPRLGDEKAALRQCSRWSLHKATQPAPPPFASRCSLLQVGQLSCDSPPRCVLDYCVPLLVLRLRARPGPITVFFARCLVRFCIT